MADKDTTPKYIKISAVIDDSDRGEPWGAITNVRPVKRLEEQTRTPTEESPGVSSNSPADPNTAELVLSGGGSEPLRVAVPVQRTTCHDDGGGMVRHALALRPGDDRVDLFVAGMQVDSWRAESSIQDGSAMGLAPPVPPTKSYTVLARSVRSGVGEEQANEDILGPWQALVVGAPTADYHIDANQFPGASSIEIQVKEVVGFDERLLEPERIELEKVAANRG